MSEDTIRQIFAKNLNYYLKKNEKTQADLVKYIGISSSTVSNWCTGQKMPRADKIQSIANWLHIEIGDLMQEKESEDRYYINEETAEMAQQIFENKDLRVLFDAAKDADPEDLQTVHSMLLALKRKERGYSDID